jgi:hypothetical protein
MDASLAAGFLIFGAALGSLITFAAFKGHAERQQKAEKSRTPET